MAIEPVERIINKRLSYYYDASEPQTIQVMVVRPFALRNGSGVTVRRNTKIYVGAKEREYLIGSGLVCDVEPEQPGPEASSQEEIEAQRLADQAVEAARIEQEKERTRLLGQTESKTHTQKRRAGAPRR